MKFGQNNILFMDHLGVVGGGQTLLIRNVELAMSQNLNVEVRVPLGGELEKVLRQKFEGRIRIEHLYCPELGEGKKNLADVAKLFISVLVNIFQLGTLARFKIIYVNGARLFPLSFLVSLFFKKPMFIYHIHLDHSPWEKFLLYQIFKRRSRSQFILISNFVRDRLFQYRPEFKTSNRLKIVENSLSEVESSLKFENRFREEGKYGFRIAVPGRVAPYKGQDVVVELAHQFQQHQFFIIGDSDFSSRSFLKDLMRRSSRNVIFCGKSENLSESFRKERIQISLIPSKWEEPFGLVATESMASSCLTIVSQKGELSQIAQKTGALIFRNPEELAEIILKLERTSNANLEELAKRQFDGCIKHYSFGAYRTKMGQIFNEALL